MPVYFILSVQYSVVQFSAVQYLSLFLFLVMVLVGSWQGGVGVSLTTAGTPSGVSFTKKYLVDKTRRYPSHIPEWRPHQQAVYFPALVGCWRESFSLSFGVYSVFTLIPSAGVNFEAKHTLFPLLLYSTAAYFTFHPRQVLGIIKTNH